MCTAQNSPAAAPSPHSAAASRGGEFVVDNETCVKCLKCLGECRKGAIKYGKQPVKFSPKRRDFIFAAITLVVLGGAVKAGIEIGKNFAKKVRDLILPALYDNERKFIKSIVLLSSGLFVCGVLFCLFFILPLIINFGMSFSSGQIHAVFGISNVINLSLWLAVVFGLMFQMPLVTHSLIKSGIVDYKTISDKRPYVVVGLLILAAVLTPPDVVSQVMLFVPTYALFELGLLFSRGSRNE